jgi:hypothetical protein
MITVKIYNRGETIVLQCHTCGQSVYVSDFIKTYCVWCSSYMPNFTALQNSAYLREKYHFSEEIYGVKVKSKGNIKV